LTLALPPVTVPRVAANFPILGPRHFAVKHLIAFALIFFLHAYGRLQAPSQRPKPAAQELDEYTYPEPPTQAPGSSNGKRRYFTAMIDFAVRTCMPSFSLVSPFASTGLPTRSSSFAFLFSVKLPASV
jgi:hypothetical protein